MPKNIWRISIVVLFLVGLQPADFVFAKQVPRFGGYIGAPDSREQPTEAQEFNKFMLSNKGKVVYLSVFLDSEQKADFESGLEKPDARNRIIFLVRNDYSKNELFEGNEYLIHLPANIKDYQFEYIPATGNLAGYFKIFNINGPRQGTTSVNLQPSIQPN